MRISIIVPAYNAAKYLEKCIQSIQRQTADNWECIIVDDGSTDTTYETALALTEGDDRFTVITQENRGCGGARNGGLAMAEGDAVCFVDADDWVESTFVEVLRSRAREYPAVGRIIGIEAQHWMEHGGLMSVWAIAPAGFLPATDTRIFNATTCDIGHATACLYVKKNIPFEVVFPCVKMFEDLLFNIALIFGGVNNYVDSRVIYNYARRFGTLIGQTLSKPEADLILAAFDQYAEKLQPEEEAYNRCKKFLQNAVNGRREK